MISVLVFQPSGLVHADSEESAKLAELNKLVQYSQAIQQHYLQLFELFNKIDEVDSLFDRLRDGDIKAGEAVPTQRRILKSVRLQSAKLAKVRRQIRQPHLQREKFREIVRALGVFIVDLESQIAIMLREYEKMVDRQLARRNIDHNHRQRFYFRRARLMLEGENTMMRVSQKQVKQSHPQYQLIMSILESNAAILVILDLSEKIVMSQANNKLIAGAQDKVERHLAVIADIHRTGRANMKTLRAQVAAQQVLQPAKKHKALEPILQMIDTYSDSFDAEDGVAKAVHSMSQAMSGGVDVDRYQDLMQELQRHVQNRMALQQKRLELVQQFSRMQQQ